MKIWNPWLDSIQNEALDLTVKKDTDEDRRNDKKNSIYQNNYFLSSFTNYYKESTLKSQSSESIKMSKVNKEKLKKSSKRLERKTRAKTLKKIESIKETCDCRFCYEDHIIKMRIKSVKNTKLLCQF